MKTFCRNFLEIIVNSLPSALKAWIKNYFKFFVDSIELNFHSRAHESFINNQIFIHTAARNIQSNCFCKFGKLHRINNLNFIIWRRRKERVHWFHKTAVFLSESALNWEKVFFKKKCWEFMWMNFSCI